MRIYFTPTTMPLAERLPEEKILDGFFTGVGYRVLSELETGYGRSDLVVLDPVRRRCLVLELKHVDNGTNMETASLEAVSQPVRNKYESQLIYQGFSERLCYGMAFRDKQALVKKL